MKHYIAVTALVLTAALAAGPAGASTQTITATLGSSVSMTTTPDATVSGWSLAATGANTTSGGSMVINANTAYTATVTGDRTRMTEYDGAGYVADGKELATALSVIAARTGGTALVPGVGATAVIGTLDALATGTGGGTDQYSITLSQPTVITDEPLEEGHTYRIVLTYTASAVL